MSYLSSSTHAAVIADAAGTVPGLYSSIRSIFINDLPAALQTLPEDNLKLAFATILAFDLKPYGNGGGLDLASNLAAADINCDNYCILARELYKLMNPTPGVEPKIIGWNGGAVGNHAQLFMTADGVHLMADPTIGYLVKGQTLNGLTRGLGGLPANAKSFFSFNSGRTNIAALNANVQSAVSTGGYYASHLLYYFPTIDDYVAAPGSAAWATPQSWSI
ncbi:hypothetical protein ASE61_15140 [Bosea sp. Root670]|uniref:hypothetical protein n=1 Tax=Bosea sp. Root670 TaxID=1736583 RepID=UPI000713CA0E|nr:hypothetical protein [Bosea sp. Root670]KRE02610.1 hypothetical protein ASE61_15140 [Bosea sp. Root670]